MQVSIVVLTYNPVWEKLKHTLESILLQRGILFEIVLSDDGSEVNWFYKAKDLMEKHNFHNIKIIEHMNNVGTVKNLYDAIQVCGGEYYFGISPGDYFYDDSTILNLYNFAKVNDAKIVFGDAVYYTKYNNIKEELELARGIPSDPLFPSLYSDNKMKCIRMLLLGGNNILGSVYFRSVEFAKKYLERFVGKVRYLEDYPSLIYAIMECEKIFYFPYYVIWYEYGEGISTATNLVWKAKLRRDFVTACNEIADLYDTNFFIKSMLKYVCCENKKEKLYFILKSLNLYILYGKLEFLYYKKIVKPNMANFREIDFSMIRILYNNQDKGEKNTGC